MVGVVTTPGPERRRSTGYVEVVRSTPPDVDVIVSNHPRRLAAMIAPLRLDLILRGSFPWRIPAEVLHMPRFGAINGHPASLPRYRGPNSVGWALRNGEPELGMTVHRMDADFDTGPILAQGAVPIGDDDTAESIFSRLGPMIFTLFPAAIAKVLNGEPGEPQDEALASEAPLFEPADRYIDWTHSAREIHNLVRGWHGRNEVPLGAFADLEGERFVIARTRLVHEPHRGVAAAGTVLHRDPEAGALLVQCGDGPLLLLNYGPVAVA